MTIIQYDIVAGPPKAVKWELPGNPDSLRSPIPRGTLNFHGTEPILAKGANDEIGFRLDVNLPNGFVYVPKDFMVRMVSDDLVNNWELFGNGTYSRPSAGSPATGGAGNNAFNFQSPGASFTNAAIKTVIWGPEGGTPKAIMRGGDELVMFFSEMGAGVATAGDMSWSIQWYVYDVDQIDKWELNTPIPVTNLAVF